MLAAVKINRVVLVIKLRRVSAASSFSLASSLVIRGSFCFVSFYIAAHVPLR